MQASCDFEQPRGQPYSRPPDFFNRSSRAQAGSVLRAAGVSLEPVRVCAVGLAFGLMISCSGQSESRATPAPESRTTPVATPPLAAPTGAEVVTGGCGTTENYEGGSLPDWAWSTQVSFDGDDSGRTASELQRWIDAGFSELVIY